MIAVVASVVAFVASAAPFDLEYGVKISMRDGVQLDATLYIPHDAARGQPRPVIVSMTPYVADSLVGRGDWFASHGFAFAAVDVRGRGNSAGAFEPFVHDGEDGFDVVEWLAKQPFCDGKVAMWGGSYLGLDQWATAAQLPPHLATIVPAASSYAGLRFPMVDDVFNNYAIRWLTLTSGKTDNDKLFSDDTFWRAKFTEAYTKHIAYENLDDVVGNHSTVWRTWIAHPTHDAYWSKLAPTKEQLAKMKLPVLNITGQYDAAEVSTLTRYREHLAQGGDDWIVIGPWDHGGTRNPQREIGGLTFAEASIVDMNELHRAWYAFTMLYEARPQLLANRVVYYVAGDETWRATDALEHATTTTTTLYLGGPARGVYASGSLSSTKATGKDAYTYDPLDIHHADSEQTKIVHEYTDQRFDDEIDGDGLVYQSAPFAKDTLVVGQPRFDAFIAIDTRDTDFTVRISALLPDGTMIALGDDVKRGRYNQSIEKETLVAPNAIVKYAFVNFPWIARKLPKGTRLRLVVTSPNNIFAQKNYNSGGIIAKETAKDAKTAHVSVFHDDTHPSALTIPLGAP